MSDEDPRDLLEDLHAETIRLLLKRVKDGSATAADLQVARALCRDASVGSLPVPGSPLGNLAESLPTFTDLPTQRMALAKGNKH